MNYGQYDNIKLYHSISEVCEIFGVEKHVLRYWEQEFSQLSPKKRSNQRIYSAKDVELIRKIYDLLYVEKFTIEGAKLQLKKKKVPESNKENIKKILQEIKNIKKILDN